MARTSSALKANRAAIRKTSRNRVRLAAIDKLVRQTKRLETPDAKIAIALQQAIDKAASRGIIHANRAARLKSRLLSNRETVKVVLAATKKKSTPARRTKKPVKK
ncbi:MAG: 30S ribosomal protein S20 [Patescibacteria group bacterium]